MLTDSAELMHSGQPTDDCVLFHFDVAGQGGVIREDYMFIHPAVVSDMAVGEHMVETSDASRASSYSGRERACVLDLARGSCRAKGWKACLRTKYARILASSLMPFR